MRPPIDWMNWERIGEQLIDMFGYSKQEVMAYSDELENDKGALLKLYKSIVMGEWKDWYLTMICFALSIAM